MRVGNLFKILNGCGENGTPVGFAGLGFRKLSKGKFIDDERFDLLRFGHGERSCGLNCEWTAGPGLKCCKQRQKSSHAIEARKLMVFAVLLQFMCFEERRKVSEMRGHDGSNPDFTENGENL